MTERYDLAIVGGGTAGIVAATTAGRLGARVVLIERDRTGGDCLWTGCVPSKSLIAAAHTAHSLRTADRFGIAAVQPDVDFPKVMAYVRQAIERIEPVDSPAALTKAGTEVVEGTAEFTGPDELVVDGGTVRFRHALIATGSTPTLPPVPGLADAEPLTSDTVWELEALPVRLAVIGGGPIGCELGQAFARLGSQVTVIEATERLMPQEPLAGTTLAGALAAEGVRVLTSTTVTKAAQEPDGGVRLEFADGNDQVVDRVLVATGRRPRSAGLGLERAGVTLDGRGYVEVDARLRTSNRRIYAAGDITGKLPFTHVAGIHGSIAATNSLLLPVRRIDHERIPWVTFTDPEIAHVGLTKEQARARHGDTIRVRLLHHDHVDRAIVEDATIGFTYAVLDRRGRILGATVVAPRAGEMIAELTGLLTRGGRLRDLASVVHPYPTWSDGVWNAAIAESVAALQSPALRRVAEALLRLRRSRLM
ncbi:MAG: FAD-dependent oxidoreductase [Catenulispora sp.]|nr:FAD-dependent oxidoreductase [Catenulispora sp.]